MAASPSLYSLFLYSPFTSDPTLRNIINGIVAGPYVNVHDFESVANKIIEDMIGKSAFTYKFKRKDRAKTLGNMSAENIAPDRTTDPALLFQRFLVVSRSGDLSFGEVLSYELCPFPPALFEARNILRKSGQTSTCSGNSRSCNRLIKWGGDQLCSWNRLLVVTCLMVVLCSIVYRGKQVTHMVQ